MATIVFNAVGTYLGGPVGGAIGSLVGRQVDTALFGTNHRQGPRLTELAVSTSSYGQALPRHFGRMRVPGSIIWATDLVEHSETAGGGKGSPSVTTYSYTANFAVAFASRPIKGIGRIWADGKLLRGEAGDLKVGGALRIHLGAGDEAPDPLMLAAEGARRCPAHRDLAYVVFEDLELAEYYNRIPALTFEIIADDGFTLQDIVGEVIEDADADVSLQGMAGFSCDGRLADSLQALGQVIPLEADAGGEHLRISRERLQTGPVTLGDAFVSTEDDAFGGGSGYSRQRAPLPPQPPTALRYYELERDFQPGVQRASGRACAGSPSVVDLPAALDAATARALIERTARRIDWTRDRAQWRTSALDPAVAPGSIVALPHLPGTWRVADWEWRGSGVELSLTRVLPNEADIAPQLPADPGRAGLPPDEQPGPTALVAFELPLSGPDISADRPRIFAAVSSSSASWPGAALYADRGDGELRPLGPSGRARSVLGTVTSPPATGTPLLFDRHSTLEVSLVDPAMALISADVRQLALGANLALVGEEILQFARATSLGQGSWRLEGLLRGRGGTESTIASHSAGEAFVLLDSRPVMLDAGILGSGGEREVVALGRADAAPATSPVLLGGITLRPLAPVHPRCSVGPDGSLSLHWTRRARGGWQWQNGVDVPLVEQSESYLVTLGPIEVPVARWFTSRPGLDLSAAELTQLSPQFRDAPVLVRQQGTHALSDPLLLCALP
ncbi:GTA baseplate fiber-binding domain-containing protein [Novosphingobium malaysiense]|uniref:GTA baseplate fiber-binding domain-containing protein n=1 Tax=Novosphingobium malaysiense TaxID=1348853 RepID=UPI00068C504E|nr:phage tail protein [Novosphingobium malaysiense]